MEGEHRKETSTEPRLRGFFFPIPTPGHMIPLIDIAKLLSRRGVATTVVITPGNDPLARPAIDHANSDPATLIPIELILLPFPPSATHLLRSPNRQNLANLPPAAYGDLLAAIATLLPSLHDLLSHRRPDFLVSDAVLTWTADVAFQLGIPRIIFDGPGAFPLCVHDSLWLCLPHLDDDTKPVAIADLPDPVVLARHEIPNIFGVPQMIQAIRDANAKSFGVVVNTFRALEPAYVDVFRQRSAGRRAWFVGPVSLSNADEATRADRGGRAHRDTARIMSWLDSQPARSVVYVCFGSLCELDAEQMRETAAGLEASGRRFLWAVRNWEGIDLPAGWLPAGFEERVGPRGLVMRGWVPQIAILGHVATGAFVTHCGWNSVLEGVAAGLPLLTWPLMHEQFVNARLVADVLRVGVRVRKGKGIVVAAEVEEAVGRVMDGGEEAAEIRRTVEELAALAKEAVAVGGSSYADVTRMVEEIEAEAQARVGKSYEGSCGEEA